MSSPLPERPPIHAAAAAGRGDRDAVIDQRADQMMAALNQIAATSFRDESPLPLIGNSPPVAQPGRPPMTPQATGASVMMVAGGFLSLCLGTAVSAVLHFSAGADPIIVGLVVAAPPVAFLSVRGLLKTLRAALPDEHHHHYEGPVYQDQRNVRTSTRGVWAKTTNQQ